MLDESDKQRIREEEIFRTEVRKELDAKKSDERLSPWRLLNSTFTIWFLSTIVVGALTWIYSSVNAELQASARRKETIAKLETEVSGRILGSLMKIDGLAASFTRREINQSPAQSYTDIIKALNLQGAGDMGIYPEYRQRTFRSLLVELQRLVPPKEAEAIKKAAHAYIGLAQLANVGDKTYTSGPGVLPEQDIPKSLEQLRSARRLVMETVGNDRWLVQ